MINLKEYVSEKEAKDLYRLHLVGTFYFIEEEIYYQGCLQSPRILKLSCINIIDNEVHFWDENSNTYTTNIKDIYDNIEDANKAYTEKYNKFIKKISIPL